MRYYHLNKIFESLNYSRQEAQIISVPQHQDKTLQKSYKFEIKKGPNYYQVLGVEKDASTEQIKIAYKKLALRYHPDKNPSDEAKNLFLEIQNAHATLSDPLLRAQYDNSQQQIQSCSLITSYTQALQENLNLLHRQIFAIFCATTSIIINTAMNIATLGTPVRIIEAYHNGTTGSFMGNYFSTAGSLLAHTYNVTPSPFFFSSIPSTIKLPSQSSNQATLDDQNYDQQIPEDYECPLSREIMTDPVYNKEKGLPNVERSWILLEIKRTGLNPFNKQPLSEDDLISNTELKNKIDTFVQGIPAKSELTIVPYKK